MELAKKLRDIDEKDAIASYQALKDTEPTYPEFRRMGLPALDFFFLQHRLKAKTRSHLSFYDAMKSPERRAHLLELVKRYKKKTPREYETPEALLKAQYQVFQLYYGSINQFRPMVAKWLYLRLKPKRGILDYSAGWGGRLLAAMSLGIPYIGIDANTKMETSYRRMIRTLEPDARVQLFFQPSETVDFSAFDYDLVFTSPPYFMLEEYEKMPDYVSKANFLERFFVPVTLAAWKHLRRGGHMALNMPEEMFEAIKDKLPKTKERIRMKLSNRHPTNASKGTTFGKENTERHETIYVWAKP